MDNIIRNDNCSNKLVKSCFKILLTANAIVRFRMVEALVVAVIIGKIIYEASSSTPSLSVF